MDRDMQGERATELDAAVTELAVVQAGVFARRQVVELGATPGQIEHRLRSGRWEVLRPRVYRVGGAPPSSDQDAMAAVLWGGAGALASHATAARLWEFEGVRSRKVEIWIPAKRNVRADDVDVHRGTRLDRADRTTLRSIPVTTPTRTLIDIAGRLEDDRLEVLMEALFRRRMVAPERLRARLAALRRSGRAGAGRLEQLLALHTAGPAFESALETLVWRLIRDSGVPLPVRQHWVVVDGHRYRLDFAWPDRRIAVECEGYEYHGGKVAWRRGRARDGDLGAAEWTILPVTWHAATKESARVRRWLQRALLAAA
jgi:hypothetical protein